MRNYAEPRLSVFHCVMAGIVATIVAGCGSTRIDEHHTYVAERENCDVSFFRVTIKGRAKMAELKYDAGWKKAEAVDEIVKDIPAPLGDIEQKQNELLQAYQMVMLTNILNKLAGVAGDTDTNSTDTLRNLESRAIQTLSLQRRLRTRETSEVPEAPAEKFIIVLSSDPDKVMGEIATVVQRQEQEGSLLTALGAFSGNPRAREALNDALLVQRWKDLNQELAGATFKLPEQATLADAVKALQIYRNRLQDVIQIAK